MSRFAILPGAFSSGLSPYLFSMVTSEPHSTKSSAHSSFCQKAA